MCTNHIINKKIKQHLRDIGISCWWPWALTFWDKIDTPVTPMLENELQKTEYCCVTGQGIAQCQRLFMGTHHRATEHHLPHGISSRNVCYLPSNTGECTPPQPQPDRPVLDPPTQSNRRLSWRRWLVTYGDSLSVHRQSPTWVVTAPGVEKLRQSKPTN